MAENTLNTIQEIWKAIPGFPGYEVSDHGRVRSYRDRYGLSKVLDTVQTYIKPSPRYRGRLYASLSINGKSFQISIHRLVLLAFVGPCPEGLVSCHNDGNHLNNHISNLRWDTGKSNWEDRRKHGVACIGEKHGHAKITNQDAIKIRELYAQRVRTKDLANFYNIAETDITGIARGQFWKHIGGPITIRGHRISTISLDELI